jgi:hypothetical protein
MNNMDQDGLYQQQRDWSDKFIIPIQRILSRYLIRIAPIHEDTKHCADLLMFQSATQRIACRVRENERLQYGGDDFTIRSRSQNGGETEIDKIMSGWGDLYFYGWANKSETDIESWYLGDIKAVRKFIFNGFRRHEQGLPYPWKEIINKDGTRGWGFYASKIPGFIIKKS